MSLIGAGVGTVENPDPLHAGKEAASAALDSLGGSGVPDIAFVFSTSRLDADLLTRGIREVLGEEIPLFGGNANGVIGNDFVGYDGFQVAVAVLRLPDVKTTLLSEKGVAFNEAVAGESIGQLIRANLSDGGNEDSALLFFYDCVNRLKGHFVMNLATPMIRGMDRHLDVWPPTAGARVMGDMKFNSTHQWCGKELLQDSVVALLLDGGDGNFRMHTTILHGCTPTSAYHTVTQSDGATLLELDGRPALEIIGEILGPDLKDDFDKYKFFVTLGVNHGPKWDAFHGEYYANRMCVGVDKERHGLVLAEPLEEGSSVQLMRRNLDFAYNCKQAEALIRSVEASGRRPIFGLYINCAGRAAAYYGFDEEEEASYVQKAIGDRFPLLGIYEAGEIARFHGKVQLTDWSGILNLFSCPA